MMWRQVLELNKKQFFVKVMNFRGIFVLKKTGKMETGSASSSLETGISQITLADQNQGWEDVVGEW
jgi:hypothetical protein